MDVIEAIMQAEAAERQKANDESEKLVKAQSGAPDLLAAFVASLTPDRRGRLAELLAVAARPR